MCDPCKGPLDLFTYSSPSHFSVCVQDHISCRLALVLATRPLSPLLPFGMSGTFTVEFVFLFCVFFFSLFCEWSRLNWLGLVPLQPAGYRICMLDVLGLLDGETCRGQQTPSFSASRIVTCLLASHQKEREPLQTESAVQHLVMALWCSGSAAYATANSNTNAILSEQ